VTSKNSQFSNKVMTTWVIVVVCVIAVLGSKQFCESARTRSQSVESRVKGDEGAPVRIMEFMDFQCPACASGALYLKQFMVEHPRAVRLEMKYFPLPMHRHGMESARYAECASRQGKFWLFHDYLVERQTQWKDLIDARPAFMLMARDAAMDTKQLEVCLRDKSIDAVILKDKAEGKKLAVTSTPSYFVNGETAVGKSQLETKLKALLNDSKK